MNRNWKAKPECVSVDAYYRSILRSKSRTTNELTRTYGSGQRQVDAERHAGNKVIARPPPPPTTPPLHQCDLYFYSIARRRQLGLHIQGTRYRHTRAVRTRTNEDTRRDVETDRRTRTRTVENATMNESASLSTTTRRRAAGPGDGGCYGVSGGGLAGPRPVTGFSAPAISCCCCCCCRRMLRVVLVVNAAAAAAA